MDEVRGRSGSRVELGTVHLCVEAAEPALLSSRSGDAGLPFLSFYLSLARALSALLGPILTQWRLL